MTVGRQTHAEVLCLGPPSNLARALRRAPWLAERLEMAVLMGGELTQSSSGPSLLFSLELGVTVGATARRYLCLSFSLCLGVSGFSSLLDFVSRDVLGAVVGRTGSELHDRPGSCS